MSNYNYMNKNGLKVMRIASMITSIIFTIIVIIASILCDLYIEENASRITCKSCDSTNYFMLCCFYSYNTIFKNIKTFVIVIQMMKFI